MKAVAPPTRAYNTRQLSQAKPAPSLLDCQIAFERIARKCVYLIQSNRKLAIAGDPRAIHKMRMELTRLRAIVLFFYPMTKDIAWPRIITVKRDCAIGGAGFGERGGTFEPCDRNKCIGCGSNPSITGMSWTHCRPWASKIRGKIWYSMKPPNRCIVPWAIFATSSGCGKLRMIGHPVTARENANCSNKPKSHSGGRCAGARPRSHWGLGQ